MILYYKPISRSWRARLYVFFEKFSPEGSSSFSRVSMAYNVYIVYTVQYGRAPRRITTFRKLHKIRSWKKKDEEVFPVNDNNTNSSFSCALLIFTIRRARFDAKKEKMRNRFLWWYCFNKSRSFFYAASLSLCILYSRSISRLFFGVWVKERQMTGKTECIAYSCMGTIKQIWFRWILKILWRRRVWNLSL